MDLSTITSKERRGKNKQFEEICKLVCPEYWFMVWIGLESVLIHLRKKSLFYYVSTTGQFKHESELNIIGEDSYWILGEPLYRQTDSTINFLHGLLIKEGGNQ